MQERGKERLAKLHADIDRPFMPSSLAEVAAEVTPESARPDFGEHLRSRVYDSHSRVPG